MSVDAPIRNAVRRFSGRLALIEGERTWTFAELGRVVASVATGLSKKLRRGDRVGLYMQNRAEFLILQLGLERAGLVRVPLNSRYTAYELRNLLKDCEASALFLDATTADRAPSDMRGDLWACQVDGEADAGPDWASLVSEEPQDDAAPEPDLDDLCSINYTSGSSGLPKGVMLTHRHWRSVYKNVLIDRDVRPDDVLAHVGPLTHASGTYFVPFLLRGATNVVVERGSIDLLLPAIERHRVTAFSCVPTVLTRMLTRPEIDSYDHSTLRWIGYGAEAIQRRTLERAVERWGAILTQNYGLTEAMMTCSRLAPDEHFITRNGSRSVRHGSIGRPYSFVDIVLRAPDGRPVPAGEVGEITIRAEHVMQGYWRRPEETARILREGWLWSGDLAREDEDGFLYLVGRSKEMLISGGFNIYPTELEACIASCPGVLENAVVGIADDDLGEIAVAFVAAEGGVVLTEDACVGHCKPRLGFRTPKRWRFMPELPRTGNGKVDKAALRKLAENRAAPP